jgi:hypothetical protein
MTFEPHTLASYGLAPTPLSLAIAFQSPQGLSSPSAPTPITDTPPAPASQHSTSVLTPRSTPHTTCYAPDPKGSENAYEPACQGQEGWGPKEAGA